MARSTYIYHVFGTPECLLASFTVKREMVSYVLDNYLYEEMPDLRVYRARDGKSGTLVDITEEVLP